MPTEVTRTIARSLLYDKVVKNELGGHVVNGVLLARVRATLAAFATALGQFWDGYMHPAPGC
jgi:hypothetical protein